MYNHKNKMIGVLERKKTVISVSVVLVAIFGVLQLGDIISRERANKEQQVVDEIESYGCHIVKGTITIEPVQSSISITSVDEFLSLVSLYHPKEVFYYPSDVVTEFEFIHDGVKYILVM